MYASVDDYIYEYRNISSFSNYSTIGLIQNPTARLLPEGSVSFSWSDMDPYLRGSIVANPFDWLEAAYQYTDINNAFYSTNPAFSGSQSYKDKGFDVKIRIYKETDYFPQIAVGARDIAGSGKFAAEYIVASKLIALNNFYVDASLGLGWGGLSYGNFSNPLTKVSDRFKKRKGPGSDTQGGEFAIDRYFSGNMGIFGGIELYLPNIQGARIKVEYDGTNYNVEGFPFGRETSKFAFEPVRKSQSRFNYGIVYPVTKSLQLKASFVKGNTFNFGFSYSGLWKDRDPISPKRDPLKKVKNPNAVKELTKTNNLYLYRAALVELRNQDIFLQNADLDNKTLRIAYSQSKYNDSDLVLGRAIQTLDMITPEDIETFELHDVNAGLFLYKATVNRQEFVKYEEDKLYKLGKKSINLESSIKNNESFAYNPSGGYPSLMWDLSPNLRSQVGGPDGFYFGELSIGFNSEIKIAPNINFITQGQIGLGSNFGGLKLKSDSILPHVRSDIVLYLKESQDYNIRRMQLNIFNEPINDFYTKISLGILEDMFMGYGGEILYRPFDKNFAIGAEAWAVQQRDYDMMFDTLDYKTVTGHLNFYYLHPSTQVLFNLKGGRYLAKDSGFTFDFSRNFKSGLRMGVFFSLTDISKAEFGEGSFDKGFYFHIPIDIFTDKYVRGTAGFGLKPLTRDGAAILNPSYNIFGVTYGSQNMILNERWSKLYD